MGWGVGEAVGRRDERWTGVTREVWVANKSPGVVVTPHPAKNSPVSANKVG